MGAIKVTYLDTLYFHVPSTVTTGDGKWKLQMPYAGEILEYGGYIGTLGSGAGTSVDVQLRNSTKTPDLDYFDTKPTFEVDSATNVLEGGELIDSPLFNQDDVIELDIDAVSTNPADLDLWVLCELIREVEV